MAGYLTVNRLSLVQLRCEERKHRAHLKKIAEMQHNGGIDNHKPAFFPHIKNSFKSQQKVKTKDIQHENAAKSKKLLDIMQAKTGYPVSSPVHLTNSNQQHHSTLNLASSHTDFVERLAKVKGIYDVRQWKKDYEDHKVHLNISRHNKLFTPRDVGVNQKRIKTMSVESSRRPTMSMSMSTINMDHSLEKK